MSLTTSEVPAPCANTCDAHRPMFQKLCRRSDTETKAHGPSTGRGLKCLALRYGLAEMCVATELFSIQRCVGEGGLSVHKRQRRQETAFLKLNEEFTGLADCDPYLGNLWPTAGGNTES
ncbi:hypothetical protein NQZ68_013247 [Dissostichus eleginoides]|nr:hypothetical protein NQZ68_013245 [Dissostichus eleginoides]KAI9520842.1 hypothetical protein NQZ68_013247 [Dissostichus eleginoides]